jgi:hypothetical protein
MFFFAVFFGDICQLIDQCCISQRIQIENADIDEASLAEIKRQTKKILAERQRQTDTGRMQGGRREEGDESGKGEGNWCVRAGGRECGGGEGG